MSEETKAKDCGCKDVCMWTCDKRLLCKSVLMRNHFKKITPNSNKKEGNVNDPKK